MLSIKSTDCRECALASNLVDSINCQLAKMAKNLYLNILYMLDKPVEACKMSTLLHYKRILHYKICDEDWAGEYTINDIASRVRFLTVGCDCCKQDVYNGTITTTTTLPPTTTTTTTLDNIPPCDTSVSSGGVGITEFNIPLDPIGGVIVIDFEANALPDKLEILHNGIKVATSGMTVANSGPFDNLYGNPLVPTFDQTLNIDQCIGSFKGVIPKREAKIFEETGNFYTAKNQQLIWFKYTGTDFVNNPKAVIRITGTDSTAWSFVRICSPD